MVPFTPSEILFQIGGVAFYWYGVLIAKGVAAMSVVTFFLICFFEKKRGIKILSEAERFFVPVLIGGVVGARLLYVLYHLPYFFQFPFEIVAVWHGGWVWHGALVGGALTLFFLRPRVSYVLLADLCAPGLALGQAIGRWGNYFNQEAYGLPTSLPWAIPIDPLHRVTDYESFNTFHPTFLYESVLDVCLFFLLLFVWKRKLARSGDTEGLVIGLYCIIYSLGRFFIEFLRIDSVPVILGLRMPQWISIAFLFLGLLLLFKARHALVKKTGL